MDNYYVYMHDNKTNGKKYVGITKLPTNERWRNGKGYIHQYFYRAILKYGWDGFNHIILFNNLNYEEACKKEIELISHYNTTNKKHGYNIESGGNPNKSLSVETKEKLRIKITGMFDGDKHYNYGKRLSINTRQKISNSHIGLKQDDNTRRKISDWYKNNSSGELNHFYGKHHTLDAKNKISEANKAKLTGCNNPMYGKFGKDHHNSIKVMCTSTSKPFDSISDASKFYNVNSSNIVSCCNYKRKSAGKSKDGIKLTWQYI